MSLPPVIIPADFIPVTLVLPYPADGSPLGYEGEARFVGFYWDEDSKNVVWNDGSAAKGQPGERFTFSRFVRPLAFLHNVNFGSRGGQPTHLLVWDNEQRAAYMAPRESALRFLKQQDDSNRATSTPPPIPALLQNDKPPRVFLQ